MDKYLNVNSFVCTFVVMVGGGGGSRSVDVRTVLDLMAMGPCWGWWRWYGWRNDRRPCW